MDIYKFAAQYGLRFPSRRGELTAEQLFDLPLQSQTGFDLDTIAQNIDSQLTGASKKSFVEDTSSNPKATELTVALDIVKDVIRTKQEANKAIALRRQRAEERKKLLDIIAAKKDQALTSASLEELEKKLNELDA